MRYFIVTGVTKCGMLFTGRNFHMALICNGYPSMEAINKEIGGSGAVISNIIELNEADYNSFVGEKKS